MSKTDVDELTIRGAEEMLDGGGDDDDDDDDDDKDGLANRRKALKERTESGKSLEFLLRLDERSVSKTNAEVHRARKEELARQQQEDRQNGIKRGKRKAKDFEDVEEELSEGESTDMEGASLPSDDDDDSEMSELESGQDGEGRELGSDGEMNHLEQIQRRQKRRQIEDEKDLSQRKRKKLPTRGAEGWSSGEDFGEEDDIEGEEEEEGWNEDADLEQKRDKSSNTKDDQSASSRAIHEPLPASQIEEEKRKPFPKSRSTITTGTRFGLQSPYDILKTKKKWQRIMMAREQIARLSTDIINDPEVSLGFIKRLSVFANSYVQSSEDNAKRATVDDAIRASAILSLCAVFVDVLPGYRIRSLTDTEMGEKVNQELARRREWEQGLVTVYRDFLELCERITRDKTELSKVSLKAMCTLVTKATHFNYRTNLLRSLVSYLSRRSWDDGSEEANTALIEVLRSDNHGEVSLEVVRLLNRMIKEKKFKVNERVLEMLRHLRLKDELQENKRGNLTTVSRNTDAFNKSLKPKDMRKGKGTHLSKKAVKKMKEVREIEVELKEAEAEVDEEERERHQSETLKLLFVLYFSILKAPIISNKLYIATLQGLGLFAHRINVDFFRDLLDVLRKRIRLALVTLDDDDDEEDEDEEEDEDAEMGDDEDGVVERATNLMTALHCIATSFELLTGQGEALNIDLSDMVNHLYVILLPLSVNPELETIKGTTPSDSVLLLRAIHLCLVVPPIITLPTERLASFVVRLLNCSLHTPAKTSLGLLQVVRILMSKKEELKGLFDNSDRAKNGQFDASSDLLDGLRPLQSGYIPWQLNILQASCHDEIRQQCDKILAM
ncbi:hypothetical protein CBS101457_004442 [Exobasidium rhododendri]|nr:hypothetical protein CBS101457_004442 [Exobasidium rhododendri]